MGSDFGMSGSKIPQFDSVTDAVVIFDTDGGALSVSMSASPLAEGGRVGGAVLSIKDPMSFETARPAVPSPTVTTRRSSGSARSSTRRCGSTRSCAA